MASSVVSGTEGYAEEAEEILVRYEQAAFERLHAAILHLIPSTPATVLDIGAGTGRDAAAFAALGHSVVAVEPTAKLRDGAKALHLSPRIEWLDDSLPDLAGLAGRAASFDLIMMTAVWMHLDRSQRRRGMPRLAGLLRPGGILILTLRHGPVPKGRRMFEVSAEETTELARTTGLEPELHQENQDGLFKRPGVTWTRLAYAKPVQER
ncbi:MAG: class I SAM-dependent methyltransferase [Kiloniellaceae bacterium]